MNNNLLKLTTTKNEIILIGVNSIIDVKTVPLYKDTRIVGECTRIQSRGGMVETNCVIETVEEIYNQYKSL